jgi:hypothetical protein
MRELPSREGPGRRDRPRPVEPRTRTDAAADRTSSSSAGLGTGRRWPWRRRVGLPRRLRHVDQRHERPRPRQVRDVVRPRRARPRRPLPLYFTPRRADHHVGAVTHACRHAVGCRHARPHRVPVAPHARRAGACPDARRRPRSRSHGPASGRPTTASSAATGTAHSARSRRPTSASSRPSGRFPCRDRHSDPCRSRPSSWMG